MKLIVNPKVKTGTYMNRKVKNLTKMESTPLIQQLDNTKDDDKSDERYCA